MTCRSSRARSRGLCGRSRTRWRRGRPMEQSPTRPDRRAAVGAARSHSPATRRLARGRPVLDDLTQAADLAVGIVGLFAASPPDSTARATLMADLHEVAAE